MWIYKKINPNEMKYKKQSITKKVDGLPSARYATLDNFAVIDFRDPDLLVGLRHDLVWIYLNIADIKLYIYDALMVSQYHRFIQCFIA